ncbi:MAG: tRNA (adenosine(37)-N6)-dimethylallyltransferase MiaA [Pseudomonadota bacterium]|nr:tRNA (adenosine(37)-N6)-dimethylallyltransferase MiaA [Pseudomonadota bacterium]
MTAVDAGVRPLAIFLMGPTASGKTDLAARLVAHLPAEIISVDSALVYRGMDIGSAKPDAAFLARAPHHLIDIRDPAEAYSAADFAADAIPLMADIAARGRIPLLVGGTMLYFRVLLEGLAALPPSDPEVRAAINREAALLGWPALHRQLAAVDPASAAQLHPNHSQRIQRALEVHRLTGIPASELKGRTGAWTVKPIGDDYRIVQFGLLPNSRQLLHERIARRFAAMLEQGLVEEVKRLRDRGDLSVDMPSIRAVGYRQVWGWLAGEYGVEEMRARAVAATRQLAKRQLTWLRGWPGLRIITLDDEAGNPRSGEELVGNCLKILQNSPIY